MLGVVYFDSPQLPFILVGIGIALAIVGNFAFGKFKMGRISRRLEVTVAHDQFPTFLARMNARLTELGFEAEAVAGPYIHRRQVGNPVVDTHSKVPKRVEFTADQSDPRAVKIQLTLRFTGFVLGDTGESAYADNVLQYISNETDTMQLVSNRNFMAFTTLVLALWEWVVLIGARVFDFEPYDAYVASVTRMAITSIMLGVLAIVTIAFKAGELRGMWLAIIGLILSVLVLGASATAKMMVGFAN